MICYVSSSARVWFPMNFDFAAADYCIDICHVSKIFIEVDHLNREPRHILVDGLQLLPYQGVREASR